MKFIATLLASAGTLLAVAGSSACVVVLIDEPECPKSLIK